MRRRCKLPVIMVWSRKYWNAMVKILKLSYAIPEGNKELAERWTVWQTNIKYVSSCCHDPEQVSFAHSWAFWLDQYDGSSCLRAIRDMSSPPCCFSLASSFSSILVLNQFLWNMTGGYMILNSLGGYNCPIRYITRCWDNAKSWLSGLAHIQRMS
jgi:hypothetical protein